MQREGKFDLAAMALLSGLSPTVTPRMEKSRIAAVALRSARTDSRNRLTRMAIADLSL